MAAKCEDGERLFGTIWVHVFEEDTPEGAVYRPEGSDIPLSRRPRERLALEPDGTARVFMPGPDDRFIERAAEWTSEGGELVIHLRGEDTWLAVVEQSQDRLIVRASRARPSRRS